MLNFRQINRKINSFASMLDYDALWVTVLPAFSSPRFFPCKRIRRSKTVHQWSREWQLSEQRSECFYSKTHVITMLRCFFCWCTLVLNVHPSSCTTYNVVLSYLHVGFASEGHGHGCGHVLKGKTADSSRSINKRSLAEFDSAVCVGQRIAFW